MAAKTLQVHKPYPRPGCPVCGASPRGMVLHDGENFCSQCGNTFLARVFSAPSEAVFVKAVAHGFHEDAAAAPCALHELNAAVGSCERCGHFTCALCRTELGGKEYCTGCFERLLAEGSERVLPAREAYYGGISRLMALLTLIPPLGMVFGPLGLFYAVKGFRQGWKINYPGKPYPEIIAGVFISLSSTVVHYGTLVALIIFLIKGSKW